MLVKKTLKSFLRKLRKRPPTLRERYEVGRGTYGEPKVLHWGEPATLRIGSFCSIADGVKILLGGNHRVDWVTTYPFSGSWESARNIVGHPQTNGDVIIGNDVWIAEDATILSGVSIGDGAVVGACAVVTKDVLPYTIVAGNPARVIRARFAEDEIEFLECIAWWNWSKAKLDMAMPLLLSRNLAGLAAFAAEHSKMA